MITPSFSLNQDDNHIYIDIHAVFIRTQNIEIYIEGNEFIFSAAPYYLRLYLPGKVIEDKFSEMSYDISAEKVKIKVSKETPGVFFNDLDLISTLLAKPRASCDKKESKSLIEVLNEKNTQGITIENVYNVKENRWSNILLDNFQQNTQSINSFRLAEDISFDWQLPQEICKENLHLQSSYGFNAQYSNYIKSPAHVENDINEIGDPEHSSPTSRTEERILKENLKFDEEHYIADYIEDNEIQECINWESKEHAILRSLEKKALSSEKKTNFLETITLTKEEQIEILKLPRHIIENPKSTYLCILSLLFSYSYDARTTQNEPTSESPWTIGKLSPVLSCLDMSFSTIKQIVIACTRRALAYPLYRHWKLIQKCWEDVYCSLRLGKRWILKKFLEIRKLFEQGDTYYLYNKLFLDDYSVWIQTASDSVIRSLAHELRHLEIKKNEINWELEELETTANKLYLEESKTNIKSYEKN
ncbi:unnamed protein product [Pneumocystis jirovecii]|uniref:CS domain-containing protein n=1 Tax=Pneumocystis jirovecii TaxID=42068 RepID=L0PET8_PNEJI|nr:unnamed protein product [Pneumocystis jirovecii]